MIENIKIGSVASYPFDSCASFNLKKINIAYGYNGSGKSTISNFLQNSSYGKYKQCSFVSKNSNSNILVYNTKFVEDNFFESKQPGIFTLSSENKEAELNIAYAEELLLKLSEKERLVTEEGLLLKSQKDKLYLDIKDKTWEVKSTYEKTVLAYCLEGFKGDKERLYAQIVSVAADDHPESIEELTARADELLNQKDSEKTKPQRLTFPPEGLETNCIFQEAIVGSKNSYLSRLIESVGNIDWVGLGRSYIESSDGNCPFCQQVLPSNFTSELKDLFDATYEEKKKEIESALTSYDGWIEEIQGIFQSAPFGDDYFKDEDEFLQRKNELLVILEENKRLIERKVKSPSDILELSESGGVIKSLNDSIESVAKKIELYNDRVKNKKSELGKIKAKFWAHVKNKYSGAIRTYDNLSKVLEEKSQAKRGELIEIRKNKSTQNEIISENRKNITNIDLSVQKINNDIAWIGLKGFRIEKENDGSSFYRIVRDGMTDAVYKSLSEGEKTLITFLYFLESCRGSIDQGSPATPTDRIIVIDDPISSLSHNYVYEIASLIQHRIIESGFEQVIVLTHSLFFYHELVKLKYYIKDKALKKDYAFFRVVKDEFSRIEQIEESSIQNDYQSYWLAIKDAMAGRGSAIVLPNMMRNILEYYFNFIHKKASLEDALTKLGEEDIEFKPLFRFINRESHSDAINITDFGIIDPVRYVEKFKQVFVETNFLAHYCHMMGEELEEAA